jgi:serine/threonine protein phosphatase PrpC
MKAAVTSEKGIRPSMEDDHVLDVNFGNKGWIYGGIYDGHNGDYAAKYAAKRLHRIFLENLLGGLEPGKAFTLSYETVSREVSEQESGTTAVDFLIQDKRIYTANAGDARAILVNRKGVSQLTVDHRVDNPDERERVEKMGASIDYPYVVKGYQGLMPTRTIGDQYFKAAGVIATPSLNEYLITPGDSMLISACDGLWDFMNNGEVAALAEEYPEPKSLLNALTPEVLINRLGTDNLTIIAVSLLK